MLEKAVEKVKGPEVGGREGTALLILLLLMSGWVKGPAAGRGGVLGPKPVAAAAVLDASEDEGGDGLPFIAVAAVVAAAPTAAAAPDDDGGIAASPGCCCCCMLNEGADVEDGRPSKLPP